MWKTSLSVVIGTLLVATSSCGDSGSSDDDDDAGERTAGSGKGGAGAGRGGTAGAPSGGRSMSTGGGSPRGGSGGTAGEAGNNGPGQSGEGGAPNGNGGTGGKAGSGARGGSGGTTSGDAGTTGTGTAGESTAGNGGEPSTPTGCEREPAGTVLVDADFTSNVFLDSTWTRSEDTSVTLSGGIVSITTDGDVDDYIQVALTNGTLPLVIDIRQRTVESTPHNEVIPVTEMSVGGTWVKTTYLTDTGWLLSATSDFSGSHIEGPAQGEWVTVRALIDVGTSELCAKKDSDASFTRVTTTELGLSAAIENVHVRQAWDFSYEISSLRVQRP